MQCYQRSKKIATEISPRLIEIRRHFHAHPELSGREYQTAAYVAGVLSSCGLKVKEGVGKTGVIGELEGKEKSRGYLAIRTDMDALPIHETSQVEYASRNAGIMHACGHDLHTTVGLGTAMILSRLKDEMKGKVRFFVPTCRRNCSGSFYDGGRWGDEGH